jgi:hypothetical protein
MRTMGTERAASFTALLSWLEKTTFRNLMVEPCATDLGLLCNLLDLSHASLITSNTINIGLEIHHWRKGVTDISIFGGHELLAIPGINYPSFATKWPDHVGVSGLQKCFPSNLVVEFDHQDSGYRLMGLFQICDLKTLSLEAIANAIKFYAQSRRLDLGRSASTLASDENMIAIQLIMEQLGLPSMIGFVDRGQCGVKLLIPIGIDKLAECNKFCLKHYSRLIHQELKSIKIFETMLQSLLENNSMIQISLDYDLESGQLSEKIAFECFPLSKTDPDQKETNNDHRLDFKNLVVFGNYFHGYEMSVNTECNLPYGQKRPSLNLVQEQLMTLGYVHRKLTLSSFSSEVKDYIMLSSLIRPLKSE